MSASAQRVIGVPHAQTHRELLQAAVAYAVLAPSVYNTQPWRFELGSDTLMLFADRSRARLAADPDHRELLMSCAAALFNLRTALQHWGMAVRVDLLPDAAEPDLLARVSISRGRPGTEAHQALVGAMGRRHTQREAFQRRELPAAVLTELATLASQEGAWLAELHGRAAKRAVELVGLGAERLIASSAFRDEVRKWRPPSRSDRADGVPRRPSGLIRSTGALLAGAVGVSDVRPHAIEAVAISAPALVVLGTDTDTRRDWLWAGQALEHVLLAAARHGVAAAFLNQPIAVPELRSELLWLTGHRGVPQALLGLGYASGMRPTARRLPQDVTRILP